MLSGFSHLDKSTFGPYGDVFRPDANRKSPVPIEFRTIQPYSRDANEFVRCIRRGYAGWRRDEWAHGPLFIWDKLSRRGGKVR